VTRIEGEIVSVSRSNPQNLSNSWSYHIFTAYLLSSNSRTFSL